MIALYKREFSSYFRTWFGYLYLAVFLFLLGLYTTLVNIRGGYADFESTLGNLVTVAMIVIPLLTMRTLAEERKQKTDQLLYALPLSMPKIVLAKYLAALTVFGIPSAVSCLFPLLFGIFGKAGISYATAYNAIFGFLLLGAALIAVGVFLSSLTENPVIAAGMAFLAFLLMYLMNGLAQKISAEPAVSLAAFAILLLLAAALFYYLTHALFLSAILGLGAEVILLVVFLVRSELFTGAFAKLLGWISLFDRYAQYVNGIADLKVAFYYCSIAFLFLFLTVQTLEKRRWS